MTVATRPQPVATSAATAAETQTSACGVTIARSWQAASSGVLKVSRWCTVRTQSGTALALMQSWACTTS
jgi:hypothetical protein